MRSLNIEDIYPLMEIVADWSTSSRDNIHNLSNNPMQILVYNELNKYSASELENLKNPRFPDIQRHKEFFYNAIFRNKNPFLYSLVLKKKAFIDKWSSNVRDIIEQISCPSLDLCQCLFWYESQNRKNERKDQNLDFVAAILGYTQNPENSQEEQKVYDIIYEKNIKNFSPFLKELFNSSNNSGVSYILRKIKRQGFNINEDNLMDKYFPSQFSLDSQTCEKMKKSFFIPIGRYPEIMFKVKNGFRVDEKNYDYYGQTLLEAMLNSENKMTDYLKLMLPYMKNIHPKSMTLERQSQLIEKLNDQDITITYNKLLLEKVIADKDIEKIKVKI